MSFWSFATIGNAISLESPLAHRRNLRICLGFDSGFVQIKGRPSLSCGISNRKTAAGNVQLVAFVL